MLPGSEESAVTRVFSIPELLESILLHLALKDLLLSQRTSRCFRYTTQGSLRLRHKLFLEPDWSLEGRSFDAYANQNRPSRKPENNRLLLRAFPGCYPTITLVIVNDSSSQSRQASSATASPAKRSSEQWSWDVCISFPADRLPECSPAVSRPEASWRRMYLSQPPCRSLYLVRRWQRSKNPAVVRKDGITMGDFFEEATREEPKCQDRKWHESYISSDRDWHFEGNVRCHSFDEPEEERACDVDPKMPSENLVEGYVYSRTLLNGRVKALSNDWDPCLASGVLRRWMAGILESGPTSD